MQTSFLTSLLVALGLASHAAALNCYTSYVMRNFTDVGVPAGTFGITVDYEQYPPIGMQPTYYKSCITYSVFGTFHPADVITNPLYSEEIVLAMQAGSIDGQGAQETCSQLIPGGSPNLVLFNQYIYTSGVAGTNETAPPPTAVYQCCEKDLCNTGLGVVAYVNAGSNFLAAATVMISALCFAMLAML